MAAIGFIVCYTKCSIYFAGFSQTCTPLWTKDENEALMFNEQKGEAIILSIASLENEDTQEYGLLAL